MTRERKTERYKWEEGVRGEKEEGVRWGWTLALWGFREV